MPRKPRAPAPPRATGSASASAPRPTPHAPRRPTRPRIHESLRALAVPLADLKPDPRNARTHGEENIAAIMASLKKFGQVKPVLVDEATKEIVAGNATFEAARRLKWTELAAIYVAGKDHAALAIADNRTAELAGWDAVTLQLLLAELHGSDEDLYDALALEELSNSLAPEAGDNGESPESSVQSPEPGAESPEPGADQPIRDQYSVVVDCRDEADQKQLYEQLTAAGRTCRVLTI